MLRRYNVPDVLTQKNGVIAQATTINMKQIVTV